MTLGGRLDDLARNLRWAWHRPTRKLFERLDRELWDRLGHNPVALLRRLDPGALEVDAAGLAADATAAWHDLRSYLERREPYGDETPADRPLTAYFCAEFGITECLRIYSGGLGVLAGDHLKSASDLGVPLVGVGLFYREGYFEQALNRAGTQREAYPAQDPDDLPLREIRRPDGAPLRIALAFPGRLLHIRVWRADVGRVPLFLLDADVSENTAGDRGLTARLYGGDEEMRIAQEIVLGIGGYRALREMGIHPRSYHMNEGHSAFLGLELVRERMEADGMDFDDAIEEAGECCVFTTHTPVPAGHDRFSPGLMDRYFTAFARGLGVELDRLLALGREDPDDATAPFTMTVLAIRLSALRNGVSRLHGIVSREMWQGLWPRATPEEVPIGHITNGVHLSTWVDHEIGALDGPGTAPAREAAIPDLPAAELWTVHEHLRARLIEMVADRTGHELDPSALTIAFARRFATYKRATLLLSDLERLAALLDHPAGPVQVVFAGKAHPRDEGGKALIREIETLSRKRAFRKRLVFVPGYALDIARPLVRGADVWLNNPRRPMEASGTSGMKAAANGVLNASILDGWWDEAWRARLPGQAPIGWAIGDEDYDSDTVDAAALFDVFERDIVPLFYDRGPDGIPAGWVRMMAASIRAVAPVFNSDRMVREYLEAYRQAAGAAGSAIG